jgi:hypothetical protein
LQAAPKTDTIYLYNGDRITCEVKQLLLGKLTVKTSDIGTLTIKWHRVASIVAKQTMEIILRDQTKRYGTISKADSAGYVILSYGLMVEEVVPIMNIVALNQVAKNFWSGINGSVSYGLSYAKGTSNLQSTFIANAKLRTNNFLNQINLNSIISNNQESVSRKQDAGYTLSYYFKKRTFVGFLAGWQQNTELGIENRIITGLNYGYVALRTNSNLLKLSLGSSVNIEEDNQNNTSTDLEAVLTSNYNLYLFAHPKITISASAIAYPSLTSWGRFRSDLNSSVSWEIFSDFTFSLTIYFNSDNQPSSTTASTTDWGTTTSIGYTF